MVYVPEVGFRPSEGGLGLHAPVTVQSSGRTLTVDRFVSTTAGTEVRFDLTGIAGSWQDAFDGIRTELRDESGRVYAPGRSWFSNMGIAGGVRRVASFESLPADLRRIEIAAIEGAVRVSVWLDLEPLSSSGLPLHRAAEAADTQHGVAVRVRGVALGAASTIIDLEAKAGGGIRYVRGIGALMGIRRGPTRLTLRDDKGREMLEKDPTLPPRDASGRTDVAVFPAVPADATSFELVIPYLYVEESDGEVEFGLPVGEPRRFMFGAHPIRVVSSTVVPPDPTLARSPDLRRGMSTLRLDVDLGEWHDDRRLLMPGNVLVDGTDHGFRWTPDRAGGPTNAQQVSYVAVPLTEPGSARTVVFSYPTVHLRGPWTIRFTRPA